jgi:uncharacterized protein (TIGR03435 family)
VPPLNRNRELTYQCLGTRSTILKRLLGLFALLGLTPALLTTATNVGDRPPEIQFDKLLPEQPAANASFEALAGKVVVLEMWATWCGPCVGAIPHLNELADEFRGRPIVFLFVTDEEPAVVEAFLKKRPISGLVGIAHSKSPLHLYGADAIPATFLIDAKGKIAGSTDPEMLSASMLENLLMGRRLPAIDLTIGPHPATNSIPITRTVRNGFVIGGTLRDIISFLWDIKASRITGEPLQDTNSYDLSLSIPGATPSNFRPWARDVIAAAFHIKANRESRETEVWILAKTDVNPAALVESTGLEGKDLTKSGWFPAMPPAAGGSVKLVYSEAPVIAQLLERRVGKPVVDETGITGKYDFQMSYDKADPEGAIEAMRRAGFKVDAARRVIDFLVVARAE